MAIDGIRIRIALRTSTNNQLKVAESENIGANHLGFVKSLFQQYSQQLGLNSNHYPAESAFNFYVNNKITECLGGTVNIEAARENFYTELFQHTNLPRNHSFAPIIREINQIIEKYMQQQFPITYADKGKGKLQTPAVMPKEIQLPTWKKQRIESPPYLLYHHTSESTINITLAGVFTPNATLTFGQFPFQSKQRKAELLGPYGEYFEGFKSRLPTPSRFQSLPYQPDFGTQHLENPEIETPNIQTPPNQRNQNPDLIHQQNLPPVIIINQPPIELIGEPIQPPQVPPQQLLPLQQLQQQPFQQPQQSIVLMVYAPIAKLEKFTGEKNDAQAWLNDIAKAIMANNWNDNRAFQAISYFLQNTVNLWYQSLAAKPQTFDAFKQEFLRYFSNNNCINYLVNTFITIKQRDTEAITMYLGQFHRCLHQIQAINTDYFTVAQILNQFIRGLCSSILQCVHLLHSVDLQTAITNARDFEAAELKANHAQAINLVMNRSSELDSRLKQFSDSINQKLERYLANN
ncbi:hypothetical protein G9A89_023696 [Geosiphon pyriformis]|nr:hypothetical protein G9A89_023696 [Geosiphon pyriformis]